MLGDYPGVTHRSIRVKMNFKNRLQKELLELQSLCRVAKRTELEARLVAVTGPQRHMLCQTREGGGSCPTARATHAAG